MEFTQKSQELAQQVQDLLTLNNVTFDDTDEETFAPVVDVVMTVLENNNLTTCDDNVNNLIFTHSWLFVA